MFQCIGVRLILRDEKRIEKMFKKILFIVALAFAVTGPSHKASASLPIKEVVEGVKMGKELYDIVRPLFVKIGKASKKLISFIKKKHQERNKDKYIYINPLRVAAVARETEERNFVPARNHGRSFNTGNLEDSLFD